MIKLRRRLLFLAAGLVAAGGCQSTDAITHPERSVPSARSALNCTPIDPDIYSDCDPGPTGAQTNSPGDGTTTDDNGNAYPNSVFVVFTQDGMTFMGWASLFKTNYVGFQMYTFSGTAGGGERCWGTFNMTFIESALLWATGVTDIDDWTITGCM